MQIIPFNADWKFTLDEPEAPHLPDTDDMQWRQINIPHDWSVELPFNKEKGEGCTGYLMGGIGWYRKHFKTTKDMLHKKVILNFDGIYNRASIYCNGHLVKFHAYGYSPFLVDITDYLNDLNQDNIVAVRVDRTRYADSRWYTGSGIYRKVTLNILDKVHIPIWGTYFTTPQLDKNKATVHGQIAVNNETLERKSIELRLTVFAPNGEVVHQSSHKKLLYPRQHETLDLQWEIDHPLLWEIHHARLYTIRTELYVEQKKIQEETTKIGLRSFRFDVNKGFFFNGVHTLIKGVCLHHCAGLVGAAVPLDVWRRRLERLKECGCNAIRTAHNPPSEDFLNLCDEMGFLVQEEFFDEWDYPKDKRFNGTEQKVDYITRGHAEFFRETAQEDLQNSMRRDRNHPCIFQWSIGNEIEWTYPKYNKATGYFGADATGNYFWTLPPYDIKTIRENIRKLPEDPYEIGKTAHKLAKWVKELDVTRPVIANCILPSASYESGYTDALDIVGYSYRQVVYEYGHKNYPEKPIMGTENVPQWHEWKQVLEKEYVPGIFLWTGVDYLGEAGAKNPWPKKGSNHGLLDYAGFRKPSYYMFKSLWSDQPTIYMVTQTLEKSLYVLNSSGEPVEKQPGAWKHRLWPWHDVNHHWNYEKEEMTVVEVYTNCDEVSLYLNGTLLSTKYLKNFEDHIYKWAVPFQSGELLAVGKKNTCTVKTMLKTAGAAHAIVLETDKSTVNLDFDSVVHVTAQLVDKQGIPIEHLEKQVTFHVDDDNCKILGVDNGDVYNVNPYRSNQVQTHHGKCLTILRGVKKGSCMIRATAQDIVSNACKIEVR